MQATEIKGKAILENYSKQASPLLVDFFKDQKASLSDLSPNALDMLERIEEFCMRGGKRLRPALVYYGHLLLGGKDSEDIVKASLATELIHAFLLIHDDIMDESALRRGKPTMHKLYEKEGDKRFGESMGILTGDLSQCLAFNMLFDTNFPHGIKLKVAQKLNDAIIATIFGQELDLRLEAGGNSKLEDILSMYALKTARYTFESPLHLGAMLSDGEEKDFELLTSFAIPLGIAFQIQDDILGLFGDEKDTGKPEGDDIRQGKKTLLVAKALEQGRETERSRLQKLLGKKNLTRSELEDVRQIITKTGAADCARALSQKQLRLAKKALRKMHERNYNKEAIEALENIADFVVERSV